MGTMHAMDRRMTHLLALLLLATLHSAAALSIGRLGGPQPPAPHQPLTRGFQQPLSPTKLQEALREHPHFHARRVDWRRQIVLFTVSLWSFSTVLLIANKKGPSFVTLFKNGNPFVGHWPWVFMCFSLADVVAQFCEMKSPDYVHFSHHFEFWRFISAGLVGCSLAGFGTIIWFHYLNILIPSKSCDLSTPQGVATTLLKTFMHSFCWGTLSNTWGIIGRRLLRGDSLGTAAFFWRDRILGVTMRHFYFWPAWQLLAFSLVPQSWLVPLNAFGSFLWNCFMSWMSSHVPRKPIVKDSVISRGVEKIKEIKRSRTRSVPPARR